MPRGLPTVRLWNRTWALRGLPDFCPEWRSRWQPQSSRWAVRARCCSPSWLPRLLIFMLGVRFLHIHHSTGTLQMPHMKLARSVPPEASDSASSHCHIGHCG